MRLKKMLAMLMAIVMLIGVCSPVFAENSIGVTYSAKLDHETINVSDEDQIVTVTVNASQQITWDSIGFKVVYDAPLVLTDIVNSERTLTAAEKTINLTSGLNGAGFMSDSGENETITNICVLTFTVPAGTGAGEYKIGLERLGITKDYGEIWENEGVVTTTLTIVDPNASTETTVVFPCGDDGTASHNDGTAASTYTQTVNDYELTLTGDKLFKNGRDATGNGCVKLGTSSVAGTFTFTVPDDVTSVIIEVAAYKAKSATVTVNGTAYTLTCKSDDGKYDAITVDTSTNKTVSFAVTSGYRAMVNTVTYVITGGGSGNTTCTHENATYNDAVPSTCKEYGTVAHWNCPDCGKNFADEDCTEVLSSIALTELADHTYTEIREGTTWKCSVCGWYKEDSVLTIEEAIAFAQVAGSNYTSGKYYVTGEITEVYNTTYGNMYITDGTNTLTIYGTYNADGTVRYDVLETKPVAGDTVTIYGVLGTYSGSSQMKNGWITDHVVPECEHEDGDDADHNCDECGYPNVSEHSYTTEIREDTWQCACGWYKEDSILTIEEAIEFAQVAGSAYSSGKYYVTGTITEIYNTAYGNLYITDDDGNTLYIYGTYDADGTVGFSSMDPQPAVGDTITVYGVLGTYYDDAQMKNGWITEHTVPHTCAHNFYSNNGDAHISVCSCGNPIGDPVPHEYTDGVCVCGANSCCSMENPHVLTLPYTSEELNIADEDSWDHYYQWTATAAGTLTVQLPDRLQCNTYINGQEGIKGQGTTLTLTVAMGDVVMLNVYNLGDVSGTWSVSFKEPHTCLITSEYQGEAATCGAAGYKTYYGCDCGKLYEDTAGTNEITDLTAWKEEGGNGYIAATGNHAYDRNYSWSADYSTCTATGDCKYCDKVVTETVNSTSKVTSAATCTNGEVVTYTAVFTETWAEKQVKTVTGDTNPDNHKYSVRIICDSDYHIAIYDCCGISTKADHKAEDDGFCVCGWLTVTLNLNGGKISETAPSDFGITDAEWAEFVTSTWGGFEKTSLVNWMASGETFSTDVNVDAQYIVREGYTLVGYAYDAEGTQPYNNGEKINESVTIYLIWQENHVCAENLTACPESYNKCVGGYKAYYECTCGKFYEDSTATNEITDLTAWKEEGGAGYIEPVHYLVWYCADDIHYQHCCVCLARPDQNEYPHTYDETTHTCICGAVETFKVKFADINYNYLTVSVEYGTKIQDVIDELLADNELSTDSYYENYSEDGYAMIGLHEHGKWNLVDTDYHIVVNDEMIVDRDMEVVATGLFTGWVTYDGNNWSYQIKSEAASGWTLINHADYLENGTGSDWYYLSPYRAEGMTRVPYNTELGHDANAADKAYWEANQETSKYTDATTAVYCFGADGKLNRTTGIVDGNRYAVDGVIAWHVGLVEVDGEYYYFGGDVNGGGNIMMTGNVYASRNTTTLEIVNGGIYTFGADGKLCKYNGITDIDGTLYYYDNYRLATNAGLVKVDGDYYYVRSSGDKVGQVVVGRNYWVANTNGWLAAGMYTFGADGKIVMGTESAGYEGIVNIDGTLYYYIGGVKQVGAGVVKLTDENGDTFYIYVKSDGTLATGIYWPTTRNNLLDRGAYDWGENGRYYPSEG